MRKTAQQLIGGLATGDAKAQAQSAVDDLAAAYKKAFAPIDCSSGDLEPKGRRNEQADLLLRGCLRPRGKRRG